MTILTKLPSEAEKKKEAEAGGGGGGAPLVQVEIDVTTARPRDEPDLHLAYVSLSGRVMRLSRATYLCLVLCLTLATMLGLMAALHVYRSAFIRSRNYCGMYRVPLNHGIMPENTLVAANFHNPREEDDTFKLNMFALFNNNPPESLTTQHTSKPKDFEFDFELDLEQNEFESFELPEIFLGRYMHDFKVNHTVIIDTLGKKCFLMNLDRNLIPAPKNVFDILLKMREGDFDVDYEEIRKTYRVAGPALDHFKPSHGSFIPEACGDKPTFRIEESLIVKRDAARTSAKYGEYVGNKLITYTIQGAN
jgi:hypothetical protein